MGQAVWLIDHINKKERRHFLSALFFIGKTQYESASKAI
jgi:hypothetical protein